MTNHATRAFKVKIEPGRGMALESDWRRSE
jgi:KaiC/GvpD/RAD55 family RecA-like ATPase